MPFLTMIENNYLVSIQKQFLYYKTIAEKAIDQLEPEQLFVSVNEDTNSIAMIIQHLAGNMLSNYLSRSMKTPIRLR